MAALRPYCLSKEQHLNAGIGASLKFSCHAVGLSAQISTKYLPLPHRWEECQGRWCFTPERWQCVLFYVPMPYGFQSIKRNQGKLMRPAKCWASVEAFFYNCQKMNSAKVHWEVSHRWQDFCWVLPSPVCCVVPAGEILQVALGLLIPVCSLLVICLELVPNRWCCTTSPPESWIYLMQIL